MQFAARKDPIQFGDRSRIPVSVIQIRCQTRRVQLTCATVTGLIVTSGDLKLSLVQRL